MQNLGYYNGKIGPLEDMTVPMLDRVCFFGDGVYEATCSRNHIVFALDEHIDRFYNSAGLIGIRVPCAKAELRALLGDLVRRVDSDQQFVYWQVTRGTAPRQHAFPAADVPANLWVTLTPGKLKDLHRRIRLITQEDTRFLHCNIKTLNLLPSVLAAQKAAEAGCDEAVLHRGDRVTECAHSNVSILQNGILKTAPTDHYILPGIARAHLIAACKAHCIPVDETPFTLAELMAADEVIVTSSTGLCLAACEIDGRPVGGRAPELLRTLQQHVQAEFDAATQA